MSGQTSNGTILGTITDSSHAVMANVQVALTETGTNVRRTDSTNAQGYFVFPNLAPGTYRVDVEQPGFQKTVRTDIGLDANSTVRVDLQMTPGAVTETVDVTSEAPVLKTDRADTGGQISSGTLDTMPMLHNRNYQSLLEIVPGVQKSYRDHSAFFNSQEHLQSVVNGLDHRNNYMLETTMCKTGCEASISMPVVLFLLDSDSLPLYAKANMPKKAHVNVCYPNESEDRNNVAPPI